MALNNNQKQVIASQLSDEEQVLKKLKGIYQKALDDINSNISSLLGRGDANLQHVIYQVQYQKALKKQINAILDAMNTEQFTTISEYLSKCYENGFMGVMYDLQGQGIPMIMPIDQDQVVRAVQHDTKLSKPLYDSLGEDVSVLNKRIQNNISRGIAQGSSYADIARNIAAGMVGDYSKMKGGAVGKAYTVARTEAHRITAQAGYDAQKAAQSKGADVVKQWDAALDSRTRPDHAMLDGQIRELDEPFEVNGHEAQYPGGFGVAKEDINCRCASLTRARWALDDDELEELKKRAQYFNIDKTKDFEDFKQKYIEATKVTHPFEGKTYKMLPDGSYVETDPSDPYADKYSLNFGSDTIATADDYAKMTPAQKHKIEAITNADGSIELINGGLSDLDVEGEKFKEAVWTMQPDGTYTKGAVKYEAQYKVDVDNNTVLNVDVTQSVDAYTDIFDDFPYTAAEQVIDDSLPSSLHQEILDEMSANGGSWADSYKTVLKKHGYKAVHVINSNAATVDKMGEYLDVLDDALITKTKNSKLDTLGVSLVTQQKKLAKIDNKTYSGIWKDDVSVSDYAAKKGSIQAKRDYYTGQIAAATDPAKIAQYQKYLDDLDEFEQLGSQYEAIHGKIVKIQTDIKKFTPKTPTTSAYDADAYSQARKDQAYWFTQSNGGTRAADGVYRDKSGEAWRNASKSERGAIYDYTASYHKFNEPLRGIEYGTNAYLGVGNVDLDEIGVSYSGFKRGQVHKLIDDMTSIIDTSVYDSDIWTQRGVRYSGMDKFFGIDPSDFYLSESDLAAKLVGTTPTDWGFMSTAVTKGKGFSGDIIMNIYSPKGTRMMYVEPFSAFGQGSGKSWDGIATQSDFGYEAEMILQRGTQFRVTKVENSGGQWYIDMEVIDQKGGN